MSVKPVTEKQGSPRPETLWLARFINHLAQERRVSPYTLRNYRRAVATFFAWMRQHGGWQGEHLDNFDRRQISDFLIESRRRLTRRTLHQQVSALKTFFKYLLREGAASRNPLTGVPLPRLKKPLPQFLTQEQVKRLLETPLRLLDIGRIAPFRAWRDRLATVTEPAALQALVRGAAVARDRLLERAARRPLGAGIPSELRPRCRF